MVSRETDNGFLRERERDREEKTILLEIKKVRERYR